MAAFQVPQFLDSGDKILGPLNLRQFGYALGGFIFSIIIFSTVSSIYPTLGFYAVLPAVPVAGLTAYMSLGRYNGRDADFYVIKFIIHFLKPKFMVYKRLPEMEDLDKRASEWTEKAIKERWAQRLNKQKQVDDDEFSEFNNLDAVERARRIRALGTNLDMGLGSAAYDYSEKAKQRAELLNRIKSQNLSAEDRKQALQNPNFFDPNLKNAGGEAEFQDVNFFDK